MAKASKVVFLGEMLKVSGRRNGQFVITHYAENDYRADQDGDWSERWASYERHADGNMVMVSEKTTVNGRLKKG
jgi:hypothetical protein